MTDKEPPRVLNSLLWRGRGEENRLNVTERVKIISAEIYFDPQNRIFLHIKSAANPSIRVFKNLVPADSHLSGFGF